MQSLSTQPPKRSVIQTAQVQHLSAGPPNGLMIQTAQVLTRLDTY